MVENNPPQTEAGWQYKPDPAKIQAPASAPLQPLTSAPTTAPKPATKDQTVTWTASEFIAHHKSLGWYVVLMLIGAAVSFLVYVLTHDTITVGVIILCFLVFGVAGSRKPRVLAYRLDGDGLTIGQKHYPYENFKAFAIIDEGTFASIAFLPLKRFMPSITIYFAPEDEAHIVEVLSTYLPLEQGKLDLFESLMRRVRF